MCHIVSFIRGSHRASSIIVFVLNDTLSFVRHFFFNLFKLVSPIFLTYVFMSKERDLVELCV